MCDRAGNEPVNAPCVALAKLVRKRYPKASKQLVIDFENLMAEVFSYDSVRNAEFRRNQTKAVTKLWKYITT